MAAVYFDGTQIYEAGLASVIKDDAGKWTCDDMTIVTKVYHVLDQYGRALMKTEPTTIYGYYITKDGKQIHLWTKRPTDEFRQKYY